MGANLLAIYFHDFEENLPHLLRRLDVTVLQLAFVFAVFLVFVDLDIAWSAWLHVEH
jgi:hypothetical protein